MQKEDDKATRRQKYCFCDFCEMFWMCAAIVIPFYFFYDSIFFSDIIIWYIEWLGDK